MTQGLICKPRALGEAVLISRNIGWESGTKMKSHNGCLGRKAHDCVSFLLGSWIILSGYLPHPRSAPVPGRVLETYLPSTGQWSRRPCIHSTQWLVKNESILWQVLFARQQGGRGGENSQLMEPKEAGQRPCWQAEWSVFRLATSQHRSGLVKITAVGLRQSSYHSLSKRLAFLPPFLFSCV